MLYGTGANGKSTFIETIQTLLGDYAQRADFTTFIARNNDGPRNDVARLVGARLVATAEAESGKRLSEVVVKQLTGGDTISARFLYGEFFEYQPQFKIFLAANHKPVIRGTDHAIWRRIKLIPFTVTIPEEERDKQLAAKLRQELPGILAWALRGCLEWQQMGLGEPEEVRHATAEYRDEMDALVEFLEECCIRDETAKVATGVLYHAYKNWCEDNDETAFKKNTFARCLGERGFEHYKIDKNTRGWRGLDLVETHKPPETDGDPVFGEVPLENARMGEKPEQGSPVSPSVSPPTPCLKHASSGNDIPPDDQPGNVELTTEEILPGQCNRRIHHGHQICTECGGRAAPSRGNPGPGHRNGQAYRAQRPRTVRTRSPPIADPAGAALRRVEYRLCLRSRCYRSRSAGTLKGSTARRSQRRLRTQTPVPRRLLPNPRRLQHAHG